MKVTRTAMCLMVAAVAVVVIGAASNAFACSAGARMYNLTTDQGRPGDEVSVSGAYFNFAYGETKVVGPVEIRWGSESGPLLATTTDDEWTVKVTIPDSPPGYYLITAASYTASREVVHRNSQTFRVTGPVSPASSTSGGSANTNEPTPTPVSSAPAASTSSVDPAPAALAVNAAPAPALAQPSAEPSSPMPSQSPAGPSTIAKAVTSASPVTPSAAPVQSSGPVALQPGPVAAVPAQATTADAPVETVSALPEPAALWSTNDSASGIARPSLVSEPTGSRSGSSVGVGLLAFGTVSLFATGMVMATNRRRAAAHSSTTR